MPFRIQVENADISGNSFSQPLSTSHDFVNIEDKAGPSTYIGVNASHWQHESHPPAPVRYAYGWYYQDVQGYTQGPFTKQQLEVWRQHLPMDLLVWFIDQNNGSSHGMDLAKVLGDGRLLHSWRMSTGKDVSMSAESLQMLQ